MSEPASPPLRIGMLAPGYPSGVEGDYRGVFVQQLVRHLKDRGHRVCIVTSRLLPGDPAVQRIDEAEVVHRFRFWSEGRALVEYRRVPVVRTLTYLAAAYRLAVRVFAQFECDLVHSHFLVPMGPVGCVVAGRLGLPHVLTVHGSDARMAAGRRWMRPLARWVLRRADGLTASAYHVVLDCRRLGAKATPIEQAPMGIHAAFLAQSDPSWDVLPLRLISTRTLREEPYAVSTLIRAMRRLVDHRPDARCTIVGDGPDRPRYEALASELGLAGAIRFAGWVPPDRLATLLADHAIYVSTSRADGASVSLFEAMAAGAYPIVSATEANREWIRDGENGRLFPPGDSEALVDAVLDAVRHPDAVRRAVRFNRAMAAERFAWPGVAARFEAVYRRACACPRARRRSTS